MDTIYQLLEKCSTNYPDAIACSQQYNKNTWYHHTYKSLLQDINSTAVKLKAQGIYRGCKTLMLVKPSYEFLVTIYAMFAIKAVPIFVDPGMPKKLLFSVLKTCKAQALIGIPLASFLAKYRIIPCKNLEIIININTLFNNLTSLQFKYNNTPNNKHDELAAILYTSGGTGTPKGVAYSEDIFLQQIKTIKQTFGLKQGDVEMAGFPLFSLLTLVLGIKTIIAPLNSSKPAKANPKKLIKTILKNKIQLLSGSPIIWKNLSSYANKKNIKLPSVEKLMMFGAPVQEKLLLTCRETFPNTTIYTPYGATECLPVAIANDNQLLSECLGSTYAGKGTCIGKPVIGVEIKIIERQLEDEILLWDNIRICAPYVVGEILVSAPFVTKSYIDNDNATKTSRLYDKDGKIWHRMGDVGYIDSSNNLWFCGRSSHVFFDELYPVQYEGYVLQHPLVNRAALVKVKDKSGNASPTMAIELNKKLWLKSSRNRIINQLNGLLSSSTLGHKIKNITICKSMPVDCRHNIKIDRKKLGEQLSS